MVSAVFVLQDRVFLMVLPPFSRNPFRSKIAAAIYGGIERLWIKPGTKLLYLGAASGTTVSHCSDLVGPVAFSLSVCSCLCM